MQIFSTLKSEDLTTNTSHTYLSKESTSVPEEKLFCDTPKKLLTVFQLTWESAGMVERIKNLLVKS